jgi:hypothetical protein
MDKLVFQEYDENERLDVLEANSDGVEEMHYTEFLTEEELSESKTMLAQVSIKESELGDELKKIKDEYKAKTKPITQQKLILLDEIKHKSRNLYGRCYKLIDFANKEVGFYNSRGQLVYERPAKPEDLQKTIMSARRTGTHG